MNNGCTNSFQFMAPSSHPGEVTAHLSLKRTRLATHQPGYFNEKNFSTEHGSHLLLIGFYTMQDLVFSFLVHSSSSHL